MIILNNKIELDAFASKNSQPFDDVSSHDIFNDDGLKAFVFLRQNIIIFIISVRWSGWVP